MGPFMQILELKIRLLTGWGVDLESFSAQRSFWGDSCWKYIKACLSYQLVLGDLKVWRMDNVNHIHALGSGANLSSMSLSSYEASIEGQ